MVNVILRPNDCDKELYQKLSETASNQNISVITSQRNILCDIFNIPNDYDVETIYHLIHEILYQKSFEQNIPVKSVIRSHLRDYFGMPLPRAKLQYEKNGWSLRKTEKRFQVLGFLVTVETATMQEIAVQLKCSKKSVEGSLRFNKHYFEKFRIPYDRRCYWRITEKGQQDYFSIAGQIEKAEEAEAEAKEAAHRRKFELLEQKRKELEKSALGRTIPAKPIEEAEKRGIEKYFFPDRNNPVDVEIVRRLEALGRGVGSQEERFCKSILSKRLALRASSNFRGVDELIEKKLLERCQKKGKTRNDFVRELFCVHFNIKTDEVGLV